MLFWLTATLLFLLSLFVLLRPLLRPESGSVESGSDIQIYRDQLAEVETDLARGVISPSEAQTTRNEVSRRLLKAAEAAGAAIAATAPVNPAVLAGIIGAGAAVLALGLYTALGAPGLPDQPWLQRQAALAAQRAHRPGQDAAELAFASAVKADPLLAEPAPDPTDLSLIEQLRTALATRPDDLRGHELLAQTEAQVGLWAGARQTQQQVLQIKGDAATGQDYLALGEYMILAAGGVVSPEAERAIATGLTLDPANPRGRYFSGLALAQGGRPDLAYRLWTGLLAEGPPDAPWIAAINAGLPAVAATAGLPPPPESGALRGPDAAAVAAAAELDAADREAMIRGMVEGLSARLESDGGSPGEWAQLIRAYGVLGETRNAAAAWTKARQAFAIDPAGLALLQQAAEIAGVSN